MCAAKSTVLVVRSAGIAIARRLVLPIEALERRRLLASYALKTLATFDGDNGANPQAGLIADNSGNVYGTTTGGGFAGAGTAFEVVTGSGSPTTLAAFDGLDGNDPASSLVADSSGDLFGTTASIDGFSDDGTVYEIAAGSGAVTSLVTFDDDDGSTPSGGLAIDGSGDVFGAASGGANNDGTVFEVVAGSGTITDLASFDGSNGENPQGNLLMDGSGDLFGTTQGGGSDGGGTVYEVVAGSGNVTTLANFDGTDGSAPTAGVIMDSAGDVFGTTSSGGANGDGTVFEVVAGSGTVTTLATFNKTNGAAPEAGLIEDSSGNLFGTTKSGGTSDDGTVFEVAAGSGTVSDLVSFDGSDGQQPLGAVIADSSGDLYGTTSNGGGSNNDGTVFELVRSNVVVPIAPTDVTATGGVPGGIRIGWGGVSNAASYRVFRSATDDEADAALIASGITARKFTDSSPVLVSDRDFYYFVEAVNSAGHSHLSAVAIGRAAPLPLKIGIGQTSTNIAAGSASVTTGDATLDTTATVSNGLKLWLSIGTADTANATSSLTGLAGNLFAKRGLIVPDGKAVYAATFTEPGDEVSAGLTMNEAAGVLNILDLVLPVGDWTAFSQLGNEMDKIYGDTTLGSAVQSLIKGAGATTTSAVATDAKAIANDAAALFNDSDKELNVVEADLKVMDVTLTASELKTLKNTSKIEALSKELIAVAQVDTQLKTGKAAAVDFTAESD